MTSVGKAVDSVMARIDEARAAQLETFARDMWESSYITSWTQQSDAIRAAYVQFAARLQAKGYRKVST